MFIEDQIANLALTCVRLIIVSVAAVVGAVLYFKRGKIYFPIIIVVVALSIILSAFTQNIADLIYELIF